MESEQDQEVKVINSKPQGEDLESEGPEEAAVEGGSETGNDEDQADAEGNMVVRPGVGSDLSPSIVPVSPGRRREPTALA